MNALAARIAALLLSVPVLTSLAQGLAYAQDRGSAADVASIRAAEIHKFARDTIPAEARTLRVEVLVAGDYALVPWITQNMGGQALYRRDRFGRWHLAVDGGGVMGEREMLQYGVPAAVARRLQAELRGKP